MNRKIAALVATTTLMLGACGTDSGSSDTTMAGTGSSTTVAGGSYASDKGTVAQVALTTPGFSILVKAVLQAGLLTTLSGDGPFTVFAPTDEAFAKLPKALVDKLMLPKNNAILAKILTYHVVPGKLMKADLTGSIATVEGQKVTISANGTKVNGATIVAADVPADNGVIHAIDTVMVPPGLDVGAL